MEREYMTPSAGVPHSRSVPIRGSRGASIDNATANRKALAKLTPCELQTGKTAEQLRAEMQEQRARVLARYGVAA